MSEQGMKIDKDLYQLVDIGTNTFKIKYDIMQNHIKNTNYIKKPKHIIYINIGDILYYIKKISKFNENNDPKFNDIDTYISINLLNLVAHYRHFFSKKMNHNNVIILYCSTSEEYREYEKIISIIDDIIKFIPEIILIPNSSTTNDEFFYSHLIIYSLIKFQNINNKALDNNSKDIHVHLLSSTKSDLQMMSIVDKFTLYKRFYSSNILLDKSEVWNDILLKDSKLIFQNPEYSIYQNILIAPVLSLFGPSRGKRMLEEFKKMNKNKRIKTINDFLWSVKKYDVPHKLDELKKFDFMFGKRFKFTDTTFNTYYDRVKKIRYQYGVGISEIITSILSTSAQKLKDSKIENINDLANIFEKKRLSIEWLSGR